MKQPFVAKNINFFTYICIHHFYFTFVYITPDIFTESFSQEDPIVQRLGCWLEVLEVLLVSLFWGFCFFSASIGEKVTDVKYLLMLQVSFPPCSVK